ncbi:hypothetical protein [Tsukamurella soli]|uniref:Uncharacterized protein n=1 Tax=Tsukamurella soli TaxID=644556 RepID=A0ABP8JJG9_9ACTN
MRVTNRDLYRAFERWVVAGRRVGALNPDTRYALEFGSKTNGVSFHVVTVDADNRRHVERSIVPPLGFTTRSTFDVLTAMTHAWGMIP